MFACKINNGSGDHMTSVNPACDGHSNIGQLGYIFTTPPAEGEVIALYRCTRDNGGRHFDALDVGCEGEHRDGQLGWVLTGP